MDFAVPASMFVTVVQASRRTLLDELPLSANLSISMLILYGATYVMARHAFGASPGEASIQALTTSLPNYASAGLPLISALLGLDHQVAVAVAIACGSIVVSPITLVILDRTSQMQDKASIAASLGSALRKPIVLSPILAVAFVLTGIGLPDRLTRSFRPDGAGCRWRGPIPYRIDPDREHRSERRNTRRRNLFHGRHGAAVMDIVTSSDGSMERKI
jgi:malonate transporter and related proteins